MTPRYTAADFLKAANCIYTGCGTFAQRPNCSCCVGCGMSPCRCEPHPGFEEA